MENLKVSIITPTTGNPYVTDCIESIKNQTYKNIEHILVIDGKNRLDSYTNVTKNTALGNNQHTCVLPYPTGINRYNGHRIYGAMTYLVDGDYLIWLDEDNCLESNHIESLVNLVLNNNLDWAYSLRKIVDKNNSFVCFDDCESLGKWPSILHQSDYFVDVNCFFVKKALALGLSPVWYRKFREPGEVEIDRAISSILMSPENKLKYDCTKEYTVRYRTGNTSLSVQSDFFIKGNEIMLKRYNNILPWKSLHNL